ncbi:response regulator transcription factor [Thalassotalea agarivorans]|uniref:Two-component system, OmpR family, response regulator n=1 Tax=Thalassotalea agarivorans TaxID=349064 RepID=A0A1I0H3C2_THASX|nr:response regulator transcription factor [Thalassotalea agarivorans]SET78069.1 two-component system, OmpR family, response regulator [Thalassotalea agarivorans]
MTSMKNRILLIEDDHRLARSVANFLTEQGFHVKHFISGENLDLLIESNSIDLIICDVMLPGTDGFKIAKRVRHTFDGPFIFLTALSNMEDQLKGFELGADDYLAKPVEPAILLARINACLKRNRRQQSNNEIAVGNLSINNQVRIVKVEQDDVALSRYEFDLLWLLASHQGTQVSREFLFINTVGREYDGLDRTVDGRVSRLRKKLEAVPNINCRISTQWGQGYMLACTD